MAVENERRKTQYHFCGSMSRNMKNMKTNVEMRNPK